MEAFRFRPRPKASSRPGPGSRPQQLLHPVLQLPQLPLPLLGFLQQPEHHLPQGRRVRRQLLRINLHQCASPSPALPVPARSPTPPTC